MRELITLPHLKKESYGIRTFCNYIIIAWKPYKSLLCTQCQKVNVHFINERKLCNHYALDKASAMTLSFPLM